MTAVAILGCGPAGLMAAAACLKNGVSFRVFSRKQKSMLFGAQYLHAPIPNFTDRDAWVPVEYQLRGSVEDYRRKVYGKLWDGRVSPEDLETTHSAWDIRSTYDALWEALEYEIEDVEVDANGIRRLERAGFRIVNTIPLAHLCYQGHTFGATKVFAAGDAPALGIDVGRIYRCTPNTVLLNGNESPAWYRISNIFDHTTVEWPPGIKPPVPTASEVLKPTTHNCDCWPDMIKLGRYGSWTKGVLSHSAYNRMEKWIKDGQATKEDTYGNPDVPTLF